MNKMLESNDHTLYLLNLANLFRQGIILDSIWPHEIELMIKAMHGLKDSIKIVHETGILVFSFAVM